MIRSLTADPEKLHMYNDIIQDQQSRGFIERVNNSDVTNGVCHYIPHHAVPQLLYALCMTAASNKVNDPT